jgi:ubiquinone/menaquinone biosynthesis C-methylase UbiE
MHQTVAPPSPNHDAPERFEPGSMAGGLIEAEHRARYWWASAAVRGREVLDAGCGEGHGLLTLAAAGASRLIGVDLSEEAVHRARSRTADVAEVLCADVHALPLPDDSVDVVVCFEVIEHLDGHSEALSELRRVLRPEGVLLISSPNRRVYPPGNPHHVHEFLPSELEDELEKHFDAVALEQQHAWLATAIAPVGALKCDAAPSVLGAQIGSPLRSGEETYILAAASDSTLPELPSVTVLADGFEVGWWQGRLADVQSERDLLLKENAQEASSASQARGEARHLSRRVLELEQQAAATDELKRRLAAAEREFERWEAAGLEESRHYERIIEDMKSSVSWRITAPLRELKRMARDVRKRRAGD